VTRSGTRAGVRRPEAGPRLVSTPQERHEREAERAAEVVGRGGSVANWSFSAVPVSAPEPVQRQETGAPKSEDEKKREAVSKAGEAALETPQGKALKEKVLADPLVKTVTDAVTSPAGLIATGAVAAGGIAALGVAGKPLPFQPPAIPLDRITPGLSARVTYRGPVNAPTFVGLTLTYKEPGARARKPGREDVAADIARLRAQQELFKPASQKAEEEAFIRAWVASHSGLRIPLTPGPAKQEDVPKKEEKAPVQPAPASPSAAPPAQAHVDDALSTPGPRT